MEFSISLHPLLKWEAILASDCDYGDVLEFALVCPECLSEVVLAKGQTRKPHFKHGVKGQEARLDCPLRSIQYYQQKFQKQIQESHNQRWQWIQERVWTIINNRYAYDGQYDITPTYLYAHRRTSHYINQRELSLIKKLEEEISSFLINYKRKRLKVDIKPILNQIIQDYNSESFLKTVLESTEELEVLTSPPKSEVPKFFKEFVSVSQKKPSKSIIEITERPQMAHIATEVMEAKRMVSCVSQLDTVNDIFNYLIQPSNKQILKEYVFAKLFFWYKGSRKSPQYESLISVYPQRHQRFFPVIILLLILDLFFIDWVKAYDQIERGEKIDQPFIGSIFPSIETSFDLYPGISGFAKKKSK